MRWTTGEIVLNCRACTTVLSLLLLTARNRMALGSDPFRHMEDAFAGKDLGRACHTGERILFCRLGDLQMSDLDKMEPCLCTHLIFGERNADLAASLKHAQQESSRALLTIPLVLLAARKQEVADFVDRVRRGGFDGVDVTLGEEAEQPETLSVLQELDKRLADVLPIQEKLLSLTFTGKVPTVSTLEQLWRTTNITSLTFFPDYSGNPVGQREILEEDIQQLTIPRDKMLYGIKLANFRRNHPEVFTVPQACEETKSQDSEENLSTRDQNQGSLIEYLQDEVQQAARIKMAGVHLWSLADDSVNGTCGSGPFPALRAARKELDRTPNPFGGFADLDVLLSTGESRDLQFLRDPDADPEEAGKLPCERVGFYRHPSDCTRFYHCSEYRTTKFSRSGPYAGDLYKCPEGLVYDERRGSCTWPSWSEPCKGSGELLPVPENKFSCLTPGFHVDPEDCRWFYYCSDLGDGRLEAFEFLCPSGLLGFDERKLLCNWKWTVPACVDRPGSNATHAIEKTERQQVRKSKELKSEVIRTRGIPSGRINLDPYAVNGETDSPLREQRHSVTRGATPRGSPINYVEPPTTTTSHSRDDKHSPPREQKHSLAAGTRGTIPSGSPLNYVEPPTNTTSPSRDDRHSPLRERNHSLAAGTRGTIPSGSPLNYVEPLTNTTSSSPDDSHSPLREQKHSVAAGTRGTIPSGSPLNYVEPPTNTTSRDGGPVNERQNVPEKKYGTAVWRRSWINSKSSDARALPSQFNRTGGNLRGERIGDYNTAGDARHWNPNDLVKVDVRQRVVPTTEHGVPEPETFFTAGIRKMNLGGQTNRTTELQHDNRDRERDSEVKSRRKTVKEESFLFDDSPNRVSDQDVDTLAVRDRKNIPFVNVRCSKLENSEASTLGCTSEVSLTIQVGRGKDPSKYVLRDDQIVRTAYQESRGIIRKGNRIDELERETSSSPLLASPGWLHLESSVPQHKINKSVVVETSSSSTLTTETSAASKLKNRTDLESEGSPLTDFAETYQVKTANVSNANENTLLGLKHKTQKLTIRDETGTSKAKDAHSTKSMLIRFYPKGVLLNIDLKRVNEIPPQILLEVDNMLRKYIDEGDIDIDLLERKLEASTESTVEKGHKSDAQSEEVMEMIKVIENIINTTREMETVAQTQSATEEEKGKDEHLETEYININALEKNISDSNAPLGHAGTDQSPEDPGLKIRMTNDKIRNPDSPTNVSQNVSDQKPFDRRRLIRKNRYPSIREQLEKQIQHRSSQEAIRKDARPQITSDFDDKTGTHLTYRYPLARIGAEPELPSTTQSARPEDDRTNSQSSLPPEAEQDYTVRAPVFADRQKGDNTHGYSSANTREDNDVLRPSTLQSDRAPKWEGHRAISYASSGGSTSSINAENSDPENVEGGSRTLQGEVYKDVSRDRGFLYRVQENSDQRFLGFRYGDRTGTYVNRRTSQQVSYDQSSARFASSVTNADKLPTSSANPDETNVNYNLRQKIEPKRPNFENYSDKDREGVRNIGTFPVGRSVDSYKRPVDVNIPVNGTGSFVNEGYSRSVHGNTVQGKKIKILVRKLAGGEPRRERLSGNNGRNNVLRERISTNVLSALKNRFRAKEEGVELQIQYQGNVWNVPFVDDKRRDALSPAVCTRSGLFQHPRDCNTFYECFWDKWLQSFTLHVFSCPVRLVYDESVRGCARPSVDSSCRSISTK